MEKSSRESRKRKRRCAVSQKNSSSNSHSRQIEESNLTSDQEGTTGTGSSNQRPPPKKKSKKESIAAGSKINLRCQQISRSTSSSTSSSSSNSSSSSSSSSSSPEPTNRSSSNASSSTNRQSASVRTRKKLRSASSIINDQSKKSSCKFDKFPSKNHRRISLNIHQKATNTNSSSSGLSKSRSRRYSAISTISAPTTVDSQNSTTPGSATFERNNNDSPSSPVIGKGRGRGKHLRATVHYATPPTIGSSNAVSSSSSTYVTGTAHSSSAAALAANQNSSASNGGAFATPSSVGFKLASRKKQPANQTPSSGHTSVTPKAPPTHRSSTVSKSSADSAGTGTGTGEDFDGSTLSTSSSSRQLSSLLDYFPGLESSRRLTRSLTRRLRSSIGGGAGDNATASLNSSTDSSNSPRTTGCGISTGSGRAQGGGGKSAPPADHSEGKSRSFHSQTTSSMDKQQESTSPKDTSSKNAHASQQSSYRSDHSFDSRDFASSSSDSLDGSSRLHHLFESHRSNIPIHIFGALAPRMQTFLGRCQSHSSSPNQGGNGSGSGTGNSRWDSLLAAMQKHDDLSAQLQGLIELCNLLVMSNEETLGTGFPVKEMVRCLIRLLQIEHNFDIMTHACRALTYLMEALPRVTIHVTDAVPYLLEKLQRVECIDVAEQALAALELLSRRHGKNILNSAGIAACLQYIDFFSTSSQRSALQIVANCCLHMSTEDFAYLSDSLSSLSQRLTSQDKKTVDILCQIFTRLVENYMHECEKLQRICDYGLLENVQQMIITTPPILSSTTLCSVVRMLHLLCRQCSELAVRLLHLNVVAALRLLLLGNLDPQSANVELLARTPQELYELVLLIGELWPALPNDGLFEVDAWLKSSSLINEHILWTWKDEKGVWRSYMHIDNRILETAYQSKEEEITLNTMGQTFTVDLVNMIQINEETGHSQPIQRRVASSASPAKKSTKQSAGSQSGSTNNVDHRLELMSGHPKLYEEFIRCIFSVLYEIYTSVGGPAVRSESLRTLLRMIYHSDADVLKDVLKKHSISSLVAGILNSQDLKTVVPALQLARVLIDKQPDVFVVHFKREGVTHQLQKLASGNIQLTTSSMTSSTVLPSSYLVMTTATGTSVAVPTIVGATGGAVAASAASSVHPSSTAAGSGGAAVVSYAGNDLTYYATHLSSMASLGLNALPPGMTTSTFGNTALMHPIPPGGLPPTTVAGLPSYTYTSGAVPKRPSTSNESGPGSTSSRGMSTAKKRGSAASASAATAPSSNSTGGKHLFSSNNDRFKQLRSRARAGSAEVTNCSTTLTTDSATAKSASHASSSSHVAAASANSAASVASSGGSANTGNGGNFLGTGFLSNLSLPRWVRPGAFARQNSSPTKSTAPPSLTTISTASTLSQSVTSSSFNAVKAVSWVKEQAKAIISKYFGPSVDVCTDSEEVVLQKLTEVSAALRNGEVNCLNNLKSILSSDVSCFEILQSSLIGSLVEFFTQDQMPSNVTKRQRLRSTCEILFGIKVQINGDGAPTTVQPPDHALLRNFVQKLNTCAAQLEQLPVKVHDFAFGQSGSALRGLNALRFLHTQQIKCLLQRHPEEKSLRQWRKGPIKVDPLAQVSTIERYLVNRGYAKAKSNSTEEICSDDDNDSSGEDSDEATFNPDASDGLHRLQLSINDKILPPDLTIYQAVRQYGTRLTGTFADSLGSSDWLGPETWVNTHPVFYRLVSDKQANETVSDKVKHASGSKNRAKDKAHLKPVLDPKEIELKPPTDPLMQYLQQKLPVDFKDPSFECLNLLRIIFALSRFWWSPFTDALITNYDPLLPVTDFHNAKIAGKVSRQLQDPLMLIAGQMPTWIEQLILACPFLCAFEIRMALFHVLALDRDRALQRLLDNFFDTNHTNTSERLTPRLERRKVVINRDDILRQAETVLSNIEKSRAVLEVQYENEVGTGLGPTLEFYALCSKQLQKHSLQLWRGEIVKRKDSETDENFDEFVVCQRGLYPLALGRHVKQGQFDKIKNKFKLVGKLLGRALLDGRILDLPLSPVLYKWFLKEECSMNFVDLSDLDPTLFRSLQYLRGQLLKSQQGGQNYAEAKTNVQSMELDFTFPGNATVELIKGGKDTPVTLENLPQYLDLVLHWLLRAGVHRQMEIMRDSFDSILSLKHLKLFLPEEMDQLFCGARSDFESWDTTTLRQTIHPDHGYTHDSPQIHWLIKILSEYDEHHRRLFLQFITGSPRLPVGGLKNLNPPFTAVRKHDGGVGGSPDSHLPSVMTCVNYLKLPEYSTKEVMAQRLMTAITCGCFSFHLS